MKKVWIPLIAIFTLTLSANAQHNMGKKGQHPQHQKMMRTKQLNLSEDQQKEVKAINEDTRKKMQELNKNESITVKEMRDRKYAIQKERKARMDGLLTAEQKAKQTQLRAEHKAKKEAGYAKHLDKMKTNLNLTDEQAAKLKTQRAATMARAEQIKNNESLGREQKKEQMMALKTEARDQRNKIFTPDQRKKMEEMKQNRGHRPGVKK
jgi:hypothetical protein